MPLWQPCWGRYLERSQTDRPRGMGTNSCADSCCNLSFCMCEKPQDLMNFPCLHANLLFFSRILPLELEETSRHHPVKPFVEDLFPSRGPPEVQTLQHARSLIMLMPCPGPAPPCKVDPPKSEVGYRPCLVCTYTGNNIYPL